MWNVTPSAAQVCTCACTHTLHTQSHLRREITSAGMPVDISSPLNVQTYVGIDFFFFCIIITHTELRVKLHSTAHTLTHTHRFSIRTPDTAADLPDWRKSPRKLKVFFLSITCSRHCYTSQASGAVKGKPCANHRASCGGHTSSTVSASLPQTHWAPITDQQQERTSQGTDGLHWYTEWD